MNKSLLYKIPARLIVYAYALILIIPMFFVLVTSLKSAADVTMNPLGLPTEWMFSNYKEAFERAGMLRASLNSLIVATTVVFGSMANVSFVTFCITRMLHKKLGKVVYGAIIGTMLLPGGGLVSFLLMMMRLGLYNKLIGLILPGILSGLAFNVLILTNFIKAMPKEIEDAARIDGCGDFQFFFRVLLPLIKPALTALGILAFVGQWNNLFAPLIILRDPKLYTLPLVLFKFKGSYSVEYHLMFAAILMSAIPLVLIYLKYQRNFTEALAGSVKG